MGILHGRISNCERNWPQRRTKKMQKTLHEIDILYDFSGLFRFSQRMTERVLKTTAIPINP